jgi:hypothetical protein
MAFKNGFNSNIIESTLCGSLNNSDFHNNPNCVTTNNRADTDTLENTSANLENGEKNFEGIDDNNINIYRYKFTNEFTDELFKFSKIHQYDHRKDFKEAWEIWIEDNSELVDGEVRRLNELDYKGDVIDKMFKSARYYFRKKSTEKKEPTKRRIYVGSQKDLLEEMDEHIKSNISSGDFKPSDGFDKFCKQNVNLLKEQVTMLFRSGITDPNEIKAKIKKTYKNRYFLIISK